MDSPHLPSGALTLREQDYLYGEGTLYLYPHAIVAGVHHHGSQGWVAVVGDVYRSDGTLLERERVVAVRVELVPRHLHHAVLHSS